MPSISKRSLIKFGKNGIAITLPKGWCNYHELKPRDKVDVLINKKLVIKPIKNKEENDATNI